MKLFRSFIVTLAICSLLSMPSQAAMKVVGRVTVASAGTPQQMYTGPIGQAAVIIIQARASNTGNIYVGDSTLVKGTGVGVSAELAPGQSVTYPYMPQGNDPTKIFIDADNTGAAVNVTLLQ